MNAFEELTNQIEQTRELIDNCKAQYQELGLPDYIANLEISSLEQRMKDLIKLQAAEQNIQFEELEVKVETKELPSGQIPVRTLTTILGGLQSLTDSVANTILNQSSNRGPIPQDILEKNSWILKAVKAGSFIAVIDLKHENQMSFEDVPQHQIISELYNLFNASDEEEPLLEIISTLGSRTLRHYTEWIKNVRDLDGPVEVNWISSKTEANNVTFFPDKADKIYTILNEKLSSREEETTLLGRLTGINVRTSLFELYLPDGEKIVGRIVKETLPKAATMLDKNCKVELLKVITESTAGKQKVSWVLNNIDNEES